MNGSSIPAVRTQALIGFGLFVVGMWLAWQIGGKIAINHFGPLEYGTLGVAAFCVAILRRWLTGFYMFLVWLLFAVAYPASSRVVLVVGFLWGSPWRWRQAHRVVKAVRNCVLLVQIYASLRVDLWRTFRFPKFCVQYVPVDVGRRSVPAAGSSGK
jgi:hypothetical protein